MSKFKWKDLLQLNSQKDAYLSPLSCIAHIDANAFFAQVEQVRCGLSVDDPVVCVQWRSIIAVSYAARKYGISRMDTIEDAFKKCPSLKPIHTAVFKKGENFWQYHDGFGSWNKDKAKQLPAEEYKVALEPYRREGRKLLRVFREFIDIVEKASVDEVFLDLNRECFKKLMFDTSIFPTSTSDVRGPQNLQELFRDGNYDLDSYLPSVPEELKRIKFAGLVYGFDDHSDTSTFIEDWDDVLFALGSNIVQEIRDYIKENVGYTTSCGIGRTKTICKLGSNFKKPDAQTIVLNSQITNFLDNNKFEIFNFWTLGGKLGEELKQVLRLPQDNSIKFIRESWPNSYQELLQSLDERLIEMKQANILVSIDETKTDVLAKKLFDLVRGEYCQQVNPKPMIKSMLSSKNLRGKSCSNLIDSISWLEVFSGELESRIEELEEEFNKILNPKSISVVVRTKDFVQYSKLSQFIFSGKRVTSKDILKGGSKLMAELDKRFKDDSSFYPLKSLSMSFSNFEIIDAKKSVLNMLESQVKPEKDPSTDGDNKILNNPPRISEDKKNLTSEEKNSTIPSKFICDLCSAVFESSKEYQEHCDFHYAQKLSEGLNGASEDSQFLSEGERRLLFAGKRNNTSFTGNTLPKPARKKTKHSQSTKSNILKYFK